MREILDLHPEIFKKYDINAPRYTSYPALPFWNRLVCPVVWTKEVATHYRKVGSVDLYIHIPYCESLCWYCGCHRKISKNKNLGTAYTDLLIREWGLYQEFMGPSIKVGSIHLGGGTPTFLRPEDLKRLIGNLKVGSTEKFYGSIEIDPRTCTDEHLRVLIEMGVDRVSMGIQDFDLEVQKQINRIQSFELVANLVERVRRANFTSVNFDLIYGLPGQSQHSISETIEKVKELAPDLISLYSYAHLPSKLKNQKLINEENLPLGKKKRELYELSKFILLENGYLEIGLDHFAKEESYLGKAFLDGKLLRNFMGYTDRKSEVLIGLGVSAISNTPKMIVQNSKDISTYEKTLQLGRFQIENGHFMSREDEVVGEIVMNIMCNKSSSIEGISKDALERLRAMEVDGLVELSEKKLEVTPLGAAFLRNIAAAIDPYLYQHKEKQLFSRTI